MVAKCSPQPTIKSKQTELPFDSDISGNVFLITDTGQQRVSNRREPIWLYKPELKNRHRGFPHRYLPTSRLYGEAIGWRAREMRDRITEQELENVLAESLDRLWASYSASVLGAAKRVQDEGLNSILRSVLAKKPSRVGTKVDPDDAYQRAVALFGDTAGSILGTLEEFRERFIANPHMQVVIAQIKEIDTRVEELTIPRTRLEHLITDMFSGPKVVAFTDNAIDVRLSDTQRIRLASLSSGEKQLLRILLETLSAGHGTVIIDEPEISMHVDWQKRLVAAMRQLNPMCQIVMATHSPEIMADLPDSQIFRL